VKLLFATGRVKVDVKGEVGCRYFPPVFELLLTLLQFGRTALHYSSGGGHLEIVEFLVAQGFGVNAVINVGSLPMS